MKILIYRIANLGDRVCAMPAKGTRWVVPPGDLVKATNTLKKAVNRLQSWCKMGEQGRVLLTKHTFAKKAEGLIAALNSIHTL
jgi:hypothetical protein